MTVGITSETAEASPTAQERLLERLGTQADFPAISRFLTEVLAASRSDQVSTQHLSTLILKDFSLTNAILRLINSAYYRSASEEQISTISRAILLLGIDTVTNLAIGLTVFEQLRGRGDVRALKGLTVTSLLTGLYARELAGLVRHLQPEEAFICGMMCELGRVAVAHELPDRYRAIQLAVAGGVPDTTAARDALEGLDFPTIGRALAVRWNLPRPVQATTGITDEALTAEDTPAGQFGVAILCARELAMIASVRSEHERQARLEALVERFQPHLPVDRQQLEGVLAASAERLDSLAQALHITRREIEHTAPGLAARAAVRPTTIALGVMPDIGPIATTADAPPVRAELLLTSLAEIGYAISADYALNDIFMMILEGTYRVIGFEHVILALITPDRSALRGRFGLGEGSAAAVAAFSVGLTPSTTPLAQVIAGPRELLVRDVADTEQMAGIPADLLATLRPATFVMIPLVIRGTAIGAFYADRLPGQGPISDTELRDLRLLVNQAVMAVRQARPS